MPPCIKISVQKITIWFKILNCWGLIWKKISVVTNQLFAYWVLTQNGIHKSLVAVLCHKCTILTDWLTFYIFVNGTMVQAIASLLRLNLVCNASDLPWLLTLTIDTHTRLTALFPGLPRWAGTRKEKPISILLKQETVSGSDISWAICKSAPRSRQITTPASHHSVFDW